MKFPVALQLYSIRTDMEKDVLSTLKAVKEMGYDGVELAGFYGIAPAQMKAYLDEVGLIPVSAHVPMGQNVAASADGRYAKDPLADGGVSAMYGRDTNGPTALLHSVSKLPFEKASNGTLLNMKFLPQFFKTQTGIVKFTQLLRAVCDLGISHIQFNVLNEADLRAAQEKPENYRGLTVRVAGYTAYFTELARDLQDEIIARTTYENV